MIKKIYRKIESKFPQVKVFKSIYSRIPGRGMPRRYKYLVKTVRENKARKIMEIGTWTGIHALEMIEEAKKNYSPEEIEYYGFDLFELLDKNTSLKEFSIPPPSLKEIKEKLEKTGVKINLYQGYTQNTLPALVGKLPKMDFIYIDGGHSLETIKNDWTYAQEFMGQNTVVIFDDYWNRDDAGCKKIIESIDKNKFEVEILPIQDKFKRDWGTLKINFAKVIKKK
jgi:predicted O-methyltransferase YrrM